MGYLCLAITAIVSLLIGYLEGYTKKKAENRAIREDLDDMVKQMTAVTKATEEIKAKISDDTWDRQKKWEMKRDSLYEVARTMNAAIEAFVQLIAAGQAVEVSGAAEPIVNNLIQTLSAWNKVSVEYDGAVIAASITCHPESAQVFRSLLLDLRRMVNEFTDTHSYQVPGVGALLATRNLLITNVIRKELGIDNPARLQPNESSAT